MSVRNKERRFVWMSLLLAGTLSMPYEVPVWANDESEAIVQETDEVDSILDKMEKIDQTNGVEEKVSENLIDEPELLEEGINVLQSVVSGQENTPQGTLSEDEVEAQPSLSINTDSLNVVPDKHVGSENRVTQAEARKKMFNLVLPTEISFGMGLFGKERLEGLIRSKQFYMENKGFEDVCISIQSICSGKEEEDYFISDTSVEKKAVQGKKNVWIYIRWEDRNGEELDYPGIVVGDTVNPGEGKVVLKAPKRDNTGKIEGENPQSKIYFSIFGDLNSDTGRAWEDGELTLDLKWTVEEVTFKDNIDLSNLSDDSEVLIQPEDTENLKSVSNNDDLSEEQRNISNNEGDISEEQKSVSENADISEDWQSVSGNEELLDKQGQEKTSDDSNISGNEFEGAESHPDIRDLLNEDSISDNTNEIFTQ